MRTSTAPWRGVYLITPDLDDTALMLDRTVRALDGGVALLQYRNKLARDSLRMEQAEALMRVCERAGVPLVINDHVDLASAIGASGAHVGGDDLDMAVARHALGQSAILGASCYASLERAQLAAASGASYLAFGAFASSPTKPAARRADLSLLSAAKSFGLPIVAIGGVDARIAAELTSAGADLLAVISAVYGASDPARAVRELNRAFSS